MSHWIKQKSRNPSVSGKFNASWGIYIDSNYLSTKYWTATKGEDVPSKEGWQTPERSRDQKSRHQLRHKRKLCSTEKKTHHLGDVSNQDARTQSSSQKQQTNPPSAFCLINWPAIFRTVKVTEIPGKYLFQPRVLHGTSHSGINHFTRKAIIGTIGEGWMWRKNWLGWLHALWKKMFCF